jgi:hypothetical protein
MRVTVKKWGNSKQWGTDHVFRRAPFIKNVVRP